MTDALPFDLGATLAMAVRVLAAIVLVTAAVAKLRDRSSFLGTVAAYRLLPDALVTPFATLLPPVELLLGLALCSGLVPAATAFGAAGLLLLFAAAMAINIRRGRASIDCGCTPGKGGQPLHWLLVVRNGVIALALCLSAGVAAPMDAAVLLAAVPAGILLFLLYTIFNSLLALSMRAASLR